VQRLLEIFTYLDSPRIKEQVIRPAAFVFLVVNRVVQRIVAVSTIY
jgi:hypothetical protein